MPQKPSHLSNPVTCYTMAHIANIIKPYSRRSKEGFVGDSDGLPEPIVDPSRMTNREFPPADCLPGSERKIELMALRHECGLPLHHPEDQREDQGDRFLKPAVFQSNAVQPNAADDLEPIDDDEDFS